MASLTVRGLARWLFAALCVGLSGAALAAPWNLQPPVTPIAAEIHGLHEYVMILVLVIFCGVFGAMFWSVYAHRKSKGHQAAKFHENTTVEVLWTVIPLAILVVIAWPVTKTVIAQKDTSNADLTVKATGYQWKWGYEYLKGEGAGIHFFSTLATPRAEIEGKQAKDPHYLLEVDHPLVVPVNKKVRIVTTGADVIHSWWVPAFGVKQDAIPGYLRDTWFKADRTGTFRGQCAELCGKDHGFMPIVVKVVSAADYNSWVAAHQSKSGAGAAAAAGKTWSRAELVAAGAKVYAAHCAVCHQPTGKGMPPTFPALDGSKIVNGPKNAQIELVLNGKPNTPMPAWGKQISDTDIAAVITYTRNAWGNKTGEAIQPAEVAALHSK